MHLLAMQDNLITRQKFQKGILLKKGNLGDVHAGSYDGSSIAIKFFHMKSCPDRLLSEFDSYKLRHPSLVEFYGLSLEPGKFSMLMERMPESMHSFLAKPENGSLDWSTIFDIAGKIANGVGFLHLQGVSHNHLKSNNVFITQSKKGSLEVKIGDWGLSKIKLETASHHGASGLATIRWRAPETFTREYSRAANSLEAQTRADIHSFALLLWELPNEGLIPFHDKTEAQVVQLLSQGEREQINPNWPIFYQWIIEACWNDNPAMRPSMKEASLRFETLKNGPFHVFALKQLGLPKDVVQYFLWFTPALEHHAQIMKEIAKLEAIEERSDLQQERLDYLNDKQKKFQKN